MSACEGSVHASDEVQPSPRGEILQCHCASGSAAIFFSLFFYKLMKSNRVVVSSTNVCAFFMRKWCELFKTHFSQKD